MKKKKILNLKPFFIILVLLVITLLTAIFFINKTVFYFGLGVSAVVLGLSIWRLSYMNFALQSVVSKVADNLDFTQRTAISAFPLPAVACSESGEILWYNELFLNRVLKGKDAYGSYLETITAGYSIDSLNSNAPTNISSDDGFFSVYKSTVKTRNNTFNILYFNDDTELKKIAEEYALSRPSVLLFYIDSMDELLQNSRESERAHLSGQVETKLEDWASSMSGIIRKYSTERFLVILEQRYMQKVLLNKFEILDKIREIKTSDDQSVTISIGVGQGDSLKDSERQARQAIDMSLGRGGDQAAIKTRNGFDFYGGVSSGVEKQTKVRTRVVASALSELIKNSDLVYVMGHRNSDLDSLGSGAALTSAIRSLGKQAFCVVRSSQTLAYELIERYDEIGKSDLFIEPEDVVTNGNRNILTIVTDTHNPKLIEYPALLKETGNLVVIDHHRKMVDFIDNAVIFYHEPNASSASEMVSELIQYIKGAKISRLDAEGLLAGIVLDTRNFVIKAGVRTFEAAAFLKRNGADTIQVKRMFSTSMDMYKIKNHIIATSRMFGETAISICEGINPESEKAFPESSIRIAAAQAADELLYIDGVRASYVIFPIGNDAIISSRSLGDYNVQLVMENLGGGGHLTMAGAQLSDTSLEDAYNMLVAAITTYLSKISSTK